MGVDDVEVMTFNVFGTVVDWRSSIIEQFRAFVRFETRCGRGTVGLRQRLIFSLGYNEDILGGSRQREGIERRDTEG